MELTTTLKDAKEYLAKNMRDGCICPCCNQFVKLRRCRLNSRMATVLVRFYQESKRLGVSSAWLPIKNIMGNVEYNGDYANLRHWFFLEGNPDSKGEWRITGPGIQFVEHKIRASNVALLYNGECLGFSKDDGTCDITELLSGR